MRRRWHIAGGLLILALAGCRQSAMCWPSLSPTETIVAGPPHAAPEGMTWQLVPNGAQPTLSAPSDPSAACPAPARFGAPSTEPCPPKTVFVRGPQQKIVIERECEHQERKQPLGAPAPEQPERAAAAIAAQQDVILVPRTVYVPYVAQAPTRAARLVTPVEAPAPLRQPAPEKPLQTPAPPAPPPLKTTITEVCPEEVCPSECGPTTIIEIRQMHERMDRLQRLLERLTPGHRH